MSKPTTKAVNEILCLIAPGTPFRDGLENVLAAGTGALIVVGCDERVEEILDGGFHLDCPFSPAYLYELAKMDGAIILDKEINRILYANAQLVPHSSVLSTETGIRHRTAERTAKQTGHLVVSISQRRSVITLYKGIFRYALHDLSVILSKTNQALQTLEKYTAALACANERLTALELGELVTINEVAIVLQRVEMVLRVKREIEVYISELGIEGRLIRMQLEELVAGVEEEARLLVEDYGSVSYKECPQDTLDRLRRLTADELLERHRVARTLGLEVGTNFQDQFVQSRGYRLLNKIHCLPVHIMRKLVDSFDNLSQILACSVGKLESVEGIGAVRGRAIKEGLRRIQEQILLDRR
ncbi:DNA integrity scanning diadenylate cyclase DisA [Pasteuria penetrans]|uniref:DNA integrity scanning diadenylate cyclase DisA n=1 Tax=Pasteuria penetrans TaxID=86005 RepID=UPI000FB6EF45|nr:DNA integrity scanning diadenylate cyclase DisA [Pasteuria penetrans]